MDWYAVNTKPHRENEAETNLKKITGVEVFYPRLKQRAIIRRVRKMVVKPLFPGYLFAKFDLAAEYRAVKYGRGVRKIVEFGSVPARVGEEIIEAIKSRVHDGFIELGSQKFRPGQIVKIEEGPFSGLEAVFEREMTDHQRAVLLLRTLAYQVRVVTPFDGIASG